MHKGETDIHFYYIYRRWIRKIKNFQKNLDAISVFCSANENLVGFGFSMFLFY